LAMSIVESKLKPLKIILIAILLSLPPFILPAASAPVLYLAITPAVPSIPADGLYHPAFYVTVQDSSGKPYPLSQPINLTITCSDERVLRLQSTGSMRAATYYTIINASSTVTTKSTVEVTVSAPGFQSSKINAVTEPPAGTPSSLKVTLLPSTVLPQKNDVSLVVITLVDAYGKPTRAREDMEVNLFSSNVQIAELGVASVKIPKGEFSARANIICKGLLGTSTITASTSGMKTDSSTLTVSGPKPERLHLWSLPKQLVGETGFVFVGVVDSSNRPVKLLTPMTVHLFSSNGSAFQVAVPDVTIPVGEWATIVSLHCLGIGSSKIYATAQDLKSQEISVEGVPEGYVPPGDSGKLELYPLASAFPADERNCTAMVVQRQDRSGYPVGPYVPLRVTVSSSVTDIFDTVDRVVIQEGRSYSLIAAVPKYSGTVTVSAGATGFSKKDATVTVYAPLPTAVAIVAPPIPSDGEVDACLVISAGPPVPAQENTPVLFSTSDAGIGESSTSSAILLKKRYSMYFKIKGHSPGKFYLTASISGMPSKQQQLEVLEVRPSTFAFSYVKPIKNYNFPIVVQLASLVKSAAVTNEPVSITLTSNNISNIVLPAKVTIKPENTEALFFGTALTTSKTKLTISSEGFKSQTVEITPAPINVEIKIIAGDRYTTGQVVTLKTSVTLDNNPVKGIIVYWNGSGLAYKATVTDSAGLAENQLAVKERENRIEAFIDVGGAGRFMATKNILGSYAAYQLEVTSNIPVEIKGSGSYAYGQQVSLTAPETVPMPGVVGLLGGRYQFRQWQGAITSTDPTVNVRITGDQQTISVRAFYTEDSSPMITSIMILAGVAVAATALFLFIRRRRRTSTRK